MGRGLRIGVAHEGLYIGGGRARFGQAVSKRGPEGVRCHPFADARALDGRIDSPLNVRFIHVMQGSLAGARING